HHSSLVFLQRPPLPILMLNKPLRLRLAGVKLLGVPRKSLADPIGHITKQYSLRESAGVIEIARGRAAGLAGFHPLFVMADRILDERFGRLEVGKFLFR